MNYEEAIGYFAGLNRFGIRLGLDRIRALCSALGNPERGLRVAHLAGTNGKGSTAAMLASILEAAGCRAGLYISPYLERFSERIRVGGQEISPEAVAEGATAVAEAVEFAVAGGGELPTEFEAVTAMAFRFFALSGSDPVVLETGLGGRHDATNVCERPLVTAITGIGLDHTDRLGDTLEKIAWEKAGILKKGVPLVMGLMPEAARAVVEREAAALRCPLTRAGTDLAWQRRAVSWDGQVFDLGTPRREYRGLRLGLIGPHQVGNAAVAVALAEVLEEAGYRTGEEAVRRGLSAARWPGRLEVVGREPLTILDGAHNPDGARALALALEELLPDGKVALVTAVMADKDAGSVLGELAPVVGRVYPVRADNPRSMAPEELAAAAERLDLPARIVPGGLRAALEAARKATMAGEVGAVLVAGSLYLVGEARGLLRWESGGGYRPERK